MKKNRKTKLILILLILLVIHFIYQNYKINHAYKLVELKTSEIEVYDDLKLKDLIKKINGKLIDNPKIKTNKLGKQEIKFKYITDDNIKVPYTITINIVDKTPPVVAYPGTYTITSGEKTKKELNNSFFCGDNYDNKVKCQVEGGYDLEVPGTYLVSLVGIDSSNNKTIHSFSLVVKEKVKRNKTIQTKQTFEFTDYIDYKEIVNKYKNKNNRIGIDISSWQGKIDYKKLKDNDIDFVYIRVGRRKSIEGDFILDDKFKENIENLNKLDIPVGVYFYSKANSKEEARKEAKWVISKIKKYNIDLEVVFDWENWNSYPEYKLSFYKLTEVANEFTKEIESHGYTSMIYSSKYHLENIWYKLNSDVWLAHYVDQTNYKGKYKAWQLTEIGKVPGINNSLVDIDIRYK